MNEGRREPVALEPSLTHRAHRRMTALWGSTGVVALSGFFILNRWTPRNPGRISWCLFRDISGISGPGCGLTRAFAHLAKGQLAAAFVLHPMAPLLALELPLLWLWWGLRLFGMGRALDLERLALAHAALFILLWIVRLATGTLPP